MYGKLHINYNLYLSIYLKICAITQKDLNVFLVSGKMYIDSSMHWYCPDNQSLDN